MPLTLLISFAEAFILTVLGAYFLPLNQSSFLSICYFFAASLTNTTLLLFLVNTLLFYPFHILGLRKTSFGAAFTVFTVITILAVTDFRVFAIYRFHINASMIDLFINDGGDVFTFSFEMWVTIAFYCLLLLILSFVTIAGCFKLITCPAVRKLIKPVAVTTAVLLLCCNLMHAYSKEANVSRIYRTSEIIPFYYPLTASKLLKKLNLANNDAIDLTPSESAINYPLNPLNYKNENRLLINGRLPNIYMIYVDSLRADTVNKDVMPNLAGIAEENIIFKNHLSAGNATRNGVFTIFYGLPGSYWTRMLNAGTPSALVTALQHQGYSVQAFAGAQLYKPEFNKTVFSSVDNLRLSSEGNNVTEKDRHAVDDFKKYVTNNGPQEHPKFAFVFLDKLHSMQIENDESKFKKYNTPWTQPDYLQIDNHFDSGIIHNLYRNVAYAIDDSIGKLVNYLKENGEWNNSIVIFSSDHGNEFNDNGLGYYGHNSNFTRAQIHIPLIIHWPGREHREYNHITSSFDITATILPEVLGVTNKTTDYSIGKSLFDTTPRDILISSSYLEDAIITDDHIILISSVNGISLKDNHYHELDRKLSADDKNLIKKKLDIDRTYVRHDN